MNQLFHDAVEVCCDILSTISDAIYLGAPEKVRLSDPTSC